MSPGVANLMEQLFDEISAVSAAIRKPAHDTASGSPVVSQSARAILRGLRDRPGLTVPQLARQRGLSRQSVQVLADRLAAAGLVRYAANPDHRRSDRLQLTPSGEGSLRSSDRSQATMLGSISPHVSEEEIQSCRTVLKRLREALGGRGPTSQPQTDTSKMRESQLAGAPRSNEIPSTAVEASVEETHAGFSAPEDLPVSLL